MAAKRKMKANDYAREFAVGLFFFISLGLLAIFTMVINRELLSGAPITRQIVFNNVSGASIGDKVLLRGLDIGKVVQLDLYSVDQLEGQQILMTVELYEEITFRTDYLIEIRSASALGGSYVYMEIGTVNEKVPPDKILEGKAPTNLLQEAGKLSVKLNQAVDDVMSVTAAIRDGQGTLHRLVFDDDVYTEAKTAFTTLNDAGTKVGGAMEELKGAGTSVTKSLEGVDELKKQMSVAAEKITNAGVSLTDAGNKVSTAAESINATIADARSGKGTVGKFLTDEKLYEEVQAAVADLRKVMANAAKSDSSLGKMMTDDGALYTSIKGSFDDMSGGMEAINDVATKIRDGEGTAGKLVNDDQLYIEAKKAIEELRGAIGDFREQSPIMTFGSFIFGAL